MNGITITQVAAPAATAALGTLGIISLVAGSSLLAAIITVGVGVLRDWLKERKDGKFAALYVAHALDNYTKASSSMVYDSKNFESANGQMGERHFNVLDLPVYPDVNWNTLGITYTQEAMLFRAKVQEAQEELRFQLEVAGDYHDVIGMAQHMASLLGIEAAELARKIRKLKWLRHPPVSHAEKHLLKNRDASVAAANLASEAEDDPAKVI
jgi:hypothetical protein